MLVCVARVTCVAKVSDPKAFDCMQFKILTPKQILQRFPIALAQVKAGNATGNLLNQTMQIFYIEEKMLLEKYITISLIQ